MSALRTGRTLVAGASQSDLPQSATKAAAGPWQDWLGAPGSWNLEEFQAAARHYLLEKNGDFSESDAHLLAMLAFQISVYVECVTKLTQEGLVTVFNNGVTLGPNPHAALADKALNRSLQLMKELQLSPKARGSYRPKSTYSPELRSLLEGP